MCKRHAIVRARILVRHPVDSYHRYISRPSGGMMIFIYVAMPLDSVGPAMERNGQDFHRHMALHSELLLLGKGFPLSW